ncbi:MAG: hypothetical protein A2Y54_06400 [Chloroflexi bacterium RBG_16_51_16]|nr:MAG: hypothetical protein A2Y54_06400 [Chloroflexi bacterium RBG_16_51_16]
MTIEYDEKGKIYTNVVTKVPVPSVIQTTSHMLRGQVHVLHDQRLKDELDLDEPFLAVTDANILDADGQILFHAPFLAVRRSQIVWIMPVEEAEEK